MPARTFDAAGAAPGRSVPAAARWHILIVDDSLDDRAEVRRLLLDSAERRYEFSEASTGAAALQAVLDAGQPLPDCVLLDDDLPDMDAPRVLQGLADAEGITVCPVVVVTGEADAQAGREVMRAGAEGYVGKTWLSAPALSRAIENAVERWRLARERHDRAAVLARAQARDTFRLALAEATRTLGDPRAVKAAAARLLGEHLQASRVVYAEVLANGDVLLECGHAEGVAPLDGRFHLDDYGPTVRRTLEAHRNVVFADTAADASLSADERERYARIDTVANLGVPIVKDGRLVAVLAVHHRSARPWSAEEIAFVEDTAERTWEAIERARAEASLRLQTRELQLTLARERSARAEADTLASLRRHEAAVSRAMPPAVPGSWQGRLHGPLGYAAALALVGIASAVRLLLGNQLGDPSPSAVVWLAMIPAAFYLPTGPFVLAVFGCLASHAMHLADRPEYSIFLSAAAANRALLFVVAAGGLWLLARRARRSEQQALAEAAAGRAAVQALRESEERVAHAVQAAKAGTWALFPDSPAFSASDRTLELHGLPLGTRLDRATALAAIHPGDRAAVGTAVQRALEHGEPYQIEYRVPLADGGERWILAHADTVPSGDGYRLVGLVQDVTEARAASSIVRQSEEQFRRAMQHAPVPVALLDEDGHVLQLSAVWVALTGFDQCELPTLAAWKGRMRDDGATAFQAAFDALVRGDDAQAHFDIRIEPRTGEVRTWSVAASVPGLLRDGRAYLVAMARDVTDRRRAEAAVIHSEARLAQLIQLMPSFTAVLRGPEHVFELANEPYYRLIGRGPEILGQPLIAAVPELTGQPFLALLDRVYATGETYEAKGMAAILASGDGGTLGESLLDFVYVALRDPAGAVRGILVHGIDCTVHVRAERALQRREQELRLLADNTPQMLSRFDANLRHVFVNAAVERATHRPRADFLNRKPSELGFGPALYEPWERAIARVFEARSPHSLEIAFPGPNGLRHYDARLVPELAADGAVEHVLGVITDVTQRKRYEMGLAEQDRRKDEFLATLAHELRNPLAPIRNGLAILRLLKVPAPGERTLGMMDRQLDHLVHLVDDLLDVSRISLGKIMLRRGRMSVREVVEAAIESCRPLIDSKHHALQVSLPDAPLVIDGDRTRLVQALQNLLTNAAKYSEPGGRIALTVRRDGGEVAIAVADTGVGIAAETLPTLWDMFSQVRDTLDKAQGGLGIGLSLVRKLVHIHGGSVMSESPGIGLGSTFTIRLPLVDAAGGSAAVAADGDSGAAVVRCALVVDDNPDSAESLAAIVGALGHRSATAHSGPAALEKVRDLRPDVVFLDIGLPGCDGYEVARRLRADPKAVATVLVAVTGWGTEDDKRRAREAGFDLHLTKPVDQAGVEGVFHAVQASFTAADAAAAAARATASAATAVTAAALPPSIP